jgi:hypothetical protein
VMTLGRNKQKNILYLTLVSLCSASARYDWLHTIFLDLFIQTCGPSPYYGTWGGGGTFDAVFNDTLHRIGDR